MFCPKCGTEIADESAFCIACGTELSGYRRSQPVRRVSQRAPGNFPSQTQAKVELNGCTIVAITVSVIMLLTMFTVPMLKVYSHGFSFFDRYITEADLGSLRIAIVFMAACTIAGVFFKMIRKNSSCILCQALSAIILSCYFILINVDWRENGVVSSISFASSIVQPDVGVIICMGCAVALILCSCFDESRKYRRKSHRR